MADHKVLRIGHLKITDHLILGVTANKIATSDEKLKYASLKPVPKNSWNEVADALTDGSVDGAFLLAPTAMDLFKSGLKIKLILFTHRAGSILVKNSVAGIQTINDFKGKIVLIPYQLSIHHMLFHKLLTEVGLKPGTSNDPQTDVFLEVMAPSMMPEALQYDEEGEIAGFIVAEPIGTQAITMGVGESVCLSKDLWPDHPCCVFVLRDEIINKHNDAVHELTHSLVQSGLFIQKNPAEAAKIGADFLGQDAALIQKVLSEPQDRITTHRLYPRLNDLHVIQNYMYANMRIMSNKIDLEKLVDNQFAESAGAK